MERPCDICLDEQCEGKRNCNCETCASKDECPRKLNAHIRVTTKCTQSCSHCCYESSPEKSDMMSVETAMVVADFNRANNVHRTNIMGGEIVCNPDWSEILDVILPSAKQNRIVSNGDWATSHPEFAQALAKHPNTYVSISKDRWHTNKNVELAARLLAEAGVHCKVSDLDEKEEDMVPVGRSRFNYGIYSMFGTYCSKPDKKYTFLIDEAGNIYKCGFGTWNYASIQQYQQGGFRARFKEFNALFYDTFIPNCARCHGAYKKDSF